MTRVLFALMLAAIGQMPQTAAACTDQTPCLLGDRSYHVKEPDDWDGVTPLPVMLHFHGWARQGTLIVKHSRISGATRKRGVLLLAPNGLGRSWDFWDSDTGDVDFAADVIEDAAKRYPIDRENIFVSGYSYGSAMAWRYACHKGTDVRALLAVSGSIRQSEACDTQPFEVRHVHGTRDNVMDFPFGPNGETDHPVKLWRDAKGCGDHTSEVQYSTTTKDHFERKIWQDCTLPGQVVIDVHARGHFIPKGWFAKQLDELLDLEDDSNS